MNDIAIQVSNLTKIYQLYNKPIDRLKEALNPFKNSYHHDFYALNDISFEVKKGETVGIIGKNGAGKSTLLKIITGVLTPTSGVFQVNGKIASLLELGAGFNPEMTGIENIYLNGSVMGFSKSEMDKKIDRILDFADIGEFIYQPVKTYSSGMFARLAFATAINVEPDILIVDEALSVGDARFQRKCFAKIENMSEKGVSIVLVSHDLESIKTFTTKALLIIDGKINYYGESKECVIKYLQYLFGEKEEQPKEKTPQEKETIVNKNECIYLNKNDSKLNFGKGYADFEYLYLSGLDGSNIFHGGENLEINYNIYWDINKINYQLDNIISYEKNIIVGIHLIDKKGNTYFGLNTILSNVYINPYESASKEHTINFKMPSLISGDYFLTAAIAYGTHENHTQLCWYEDAIELKCVTDKKHIIGFLDLPYKLKEKREN